MQERWSATSFLFFAFLCLLLPLVVVVVTRGVGRKRSGEVGTMEGWKILGVGVPWPSDLANHQVIFSLKASFLFGFTYLLLGPVLGISILGILKGSLAKLLTEFACSSPTRGVVEGAISELALPNLLGASSLNFLHVTGST